MIYAVQTVRCASICLLAVLLVGNTVSATDATRSPQERIHTTKEHILSGEWTYKGRPSDILPSTNVVNCALQAPGFRCKSKRIKHNTKDYTVEYSTITEYSDFDANGRFTIETERKNHYVVPNDPDNPTTSYQLPMVEKQPVKTSYRCVLIPSNVIRCKGQKNQTLVFKKDH